ncbi:AIPR protein [Parafrankia irregularis]|uniref:AIPR protein n=1 Tax=Parafrankia irregularis TaxID=795642 RepID=A0A0S4QHG8_9ACTN|nr:MULTISPECIES: AIPR family protein [Parafrankia]MBE3206513.1 AIPR family protein [Parafrankia sp. CH37]CUU53994.1 AIPR protein [Parafrankia irregularis]
MSDAVDAALARRTDLDQFGTAKRLLFAVQLSLRIEDIHAVATEALTDGPDDKSCDFILVDPGERSVVIAQGYESTSTRRQEAPQSKAGSLHQAISWLFGARQASEVPERLRGAWQELHDALGDGQIDQIAIWFVHNLEESQNVKSELEAVQKTAYQLVRGRYTHDLTVIAEELGRNTLLNRYEGSRTPILVSDEFVIPVSGFFIEGGDNWTALCTSISAAWLQQQFMRYGARIFSANVRGYLGSIRSENNINNGIQNTLREHPEKFWAYNNGITALVHRFSGNPDSGSIRVHGMAIVNGAQTTGSIGSADGHSAVSSRLLARFIECSDADTVREIIRYNNRQNPTLSSDFRSNDRIQTKLVREFAELGVAGYNGGRRGGADDVIRRPGENQLAADVAAQALAAFHGRPDVSYHEKSKIWEDSAIYGSVFPERTTARHVLFVYSLLKAVERKKLLLGGKSSSSQTEEDNELIEWFKLRGSTQLAVAAIGATSEILLGVAIPDRYTMRFKKASSVGDAIEVWTPVVTAMLALAPNQLSAPLEGAGGLRRRDVVRTTIATFRGLISATSKVNAPIYSAFSQAVEI